MNGRNGNSPVQQQDNKSENKESPKAFKLAFVSEEIFISGLQQDVDGLISSLHQDGVQRIAHTNYHRYTESINKDTYQCARFNLPVFKLATRITGGGLVANNILHYVTSLVPEVKNISLRDMSALSFYAYEVTIQDERRPYSSYGRPTLIEFADDSENQSDEENLHHLMRRLGNFVVLLTPLDKVNKYCQQVSVISRRPTLETVRLLREFSKHFPTLSTSEVIDKFVNQSTHQIRRSAHLIKQALRGSSNASNFFKTLPEELCLKIASFTGNQSVHSEDTAVNVATEVFQRSFRK